MTRDQLINTLALKIVAIAWPHPVRVAIDGVDASGKTTLADELVPAIEMLERPVIRASIDGFHCPSSVRYGRGRSSPEGYYHDSFNYSALVGSLLCPLGPDGSLHFRRTVFDFRSDEAIGAPIENAQPNSILLFDGVFLLRPELREYFDLSIFVRANFEITLRRAENRDAGTFGGVNGVRRLYSERYIPGQRIYLDTCDPEAIATMVIDNNDPEFPVIVRSGV